MSLGENAVISQYTQKRTKPVYALRAIAAAISVVFTIGRKAPGGILSLAGWIVGGSNAKVTGVQERSE